MDGNTKILVDILTEFFVEMENIIDSGHRPETKNLELSAAVRLAKAKLKMLNDYGSDE